MTSRIHCKKPKGRPMPKPTRRANARRSAIRSRIEHVFAHHKARMSLAIRTIGLARARAAVTLANMAHNMTRRRWLNSRPAPARNPTQPPGPSSASRCSFSPRIKTVPRPHDHHTRAHRRCPEVSAW